MLGFLHFTQDDNIHGFPHCADCQAYGHGYMLHDEVWAKIASPAVKYLCLPCAEERIGRLFGPEDFKDAPINVPVLHAYSMGMRKVQPRPKWMDIARASELKYLTARADPVSGDWYAVIGTGQDEGVIVRRGERIGIAQLQLLGFGGVPGRPPDHITLEAIDGAPQDGFGVGDQLRLYAGGDQKILRADSRKLGQS